MPIRFDSGGGYAGTWCSGARGYALEFCDCRTVVDGFAGTRRQARDERGALAWDLEESGASGGLRWRAVWQRVFAESSFALRRMWTDPV